MAVEMSEHTHPGISGDAVVFHLLVQSVLDLIITFRSRPDL